MPTPRPSKIVCVGRNYTAHAREMGNRIPDEPLLFFKPPSALLPSGGEIALPPGVGQVDFEGEMAFVVGRRTGRWKGASRAEDPAEPRDERWDEGWRERSQEGWAVLSHVLPANDVTARALQRSDAQWTRAKGFDTFCPLGDPVPLDGLDRDALALETRVNGELRQEGRIGEMAFSPGALVAFIAGVMTLEPGDLILTGTPAGVGPLTPGDDVEVSIPGVGAVRNRVR